MTQYIRILFVSLSLLIGSAVSIGAADGSMASQHDEQMTIRTSESGLEISVASSDKALKIEIYSITGQLVKSLDIENGTERISLPKGCYIVRTHNGSKKVVVK